MNGGFDQPLALEMAYIAVEECVRLGASFADARFEARAFEQLRTRSGRAGACRVGMDQGIGIRALVRGSWAFVSVAQPTRHDVAVGARRAVDIARAGAILEDTRSIMPGADPQRGVFRTPAQHDLLDVPLSTKADLLKRIDARISARARIVMSRTAWVAQRVHKIIVNSEGTEVEQQLSSGQLSFEAGASDGAELQVASFPAGRSAISGAGWEAFERYPFLDEADRVAENAVRQIEAEPCPADTCAVVLAPEALGAHLLACSGLFRFNGARAAARGARQQLGETVGSPHLSIRCEPNLGHGAGTFAYDDEGTPSAPVTLVEEGRVRALLCGREGAALCGLPGSTGGMRASSWARPPTVRPSNLVMQAEGEPSLDALLGDMRQGLLVEGTRSIAVDRGGHEFLAVAERAWEIKDGRRQRLYKNPAYRGRTTEFWGALNATGAALPDLPIGALDGGKMQPERLLSVGVIAPFGRFTSVEVGSSALPSADSVDLPLMSHRSELPRTASGGGD